MADRSFLMSHVRTQGLRGFEAGALMTPLATKTGNGVTYVDRLSTAGLHAYFADDPEFDGNRVVEVDVVIAEGSSLAEAMHGRGPFDYAIASHVIEHVPDLTGWLSELADLVRVGGQLLLLVPDKRYTFDYLRDLSSTADVVDAFVEGRKKPSPGRVFEHFALGATVDAATACAGDIDPRALERYGGVAAALDLGPRSHRDGTYVDTHCWVVTPQRFLEVLGDLAELGILRWKLALFADTRPDEVDFGVVLERASYFEPPDQVAQTFRGAIERADQGTALDRALREVARLQAEVDALRASRSWRLTQPARWLKRLTAGRLAG